MSADILNLVADQTVEVWHENLTAEEKEQTGAGIVRRLTGDESTEEVIQLAGLDWSAQIAPLSRSTDGAVVPAWQIYRDSDGAHLAFRMGDEDKATLVQPREIVEFLADLREDMRAKWNTLGVLAERGKLLSWTNGEAEGEMLRNPRIFAALRIGPDFQVGSWGLEPNLQISYNYRTGSLDVRSCSTDTVCSNTYQMSLAENSRKAAIFRDMSAKTQKAIASLIGVSLAKSENLAARLQKLSNDVVPETLSIQGKTFDREDISRAYCAILGTPKLLDRMISDSAKEEEQRDIVLELLQDRRKREEAGRFARDIYYVDEEEIAGRKGTWYGLQSRVSQFVDHRAGRSEETRIESAYFGDRSDLKVSAVELAEVMADTVMEMR